jgi:hypothetical protein
MLIRRTYISMAFILSTLVGCSAHQPSTTEITANKDVTVAQTECYRMRSAEARRFVYQLSQIPPESRMIVVMLHNQGEMTKEIVAAATGNNVDPCQATNIFDAQIAEVKAKNKALSDTTGKLTSLGTWVVGGLTVSSLADKIGGEVVNSYNTGSEINQDSKNAGSYNTVSGDAAIEGTNTSTSSVDNSTDNSIDNSDNSDNCADGNCDDDGAGATGDGSTSFDLDSCLANPPAGISGSTPLWTPTCSCHSHSIGSC